MKKERTCIIAFTKKEISLIKCPPDKYDIRFIISTGTELEGKDISFLKNYNEIGIVISADWKKGIRECETVIIADIEIREEEQLKTLLYNIIEETLLEGKKFICFFKLEKARQRKFQAFASENKTSFTSIYKPVEMQEKTRFEKIEFKTPIIFIGEMTHECDGYEIALKLMQRLKRDNMKGTIVSENKYNALYEHQYFVQFYDKYISENSVDKIKILIKRIEEEENPDVIIIKLPKPMTAFDNSIVYDYGISAYVISQAIHADYCLYCGLSEVLSEDFIFNINEHFKHKFGYPISAFHISNQITDIAFEPQEQVDTIYIPVGKTEQEAYNLREKQGKQVYQLLNEPDFELFYKTLKNELFDFSYGRI